MEASTKCPIVGVFENPESAQRAVKDLRAEGFHDGQIGFLSRFEDEKVVGREATKNTDVAPTAATGGVTGAGIGTWRELGILAGVLPGIGPAIAGGTFGVLLTSAAGTTSVGIGGALLDMGLDDAAAKFYEGEYANGKTLVTVDGGSNAVAACRIIEEQYGVISLEG
jgi:hypothetical protein